MKIVSQCPSLYRTNHYIHQVMDQKNSIHWMEMKKPRHQWIQLYADFSQEEPIVITRQSLESLLPGNKIDESVCDLCLKW